jgi:hypothetical protein
MPIPAFTIPIRAFTMLRSPRSRCSDLGVHDRPKSAIKEAQRGEFVDLSPEENEHYLETGELPERVERWLDSYDARRGT